jgi:hypothetical protein
MADAKEVIKIIRLECMLHCAINNPRKEVGFFTGKNKYNITPNSAHYHAVQPDNVSSMVCSVV